MLTDVQIPFLGTPLVPLKETALQPLTWCSKAYLPESAPSLRERFFPTDAGVIADIFQHAGEVSVRSVRSRRTYVRFDAASIFVAQNTCWTRCLHMAAFAAAIFGKTGELASYVLRIRCSTLN